MSAPESVVRAVMEELGCKREREVHQRYPAAYCGEHLVAWLSGPDCCPRAEMSADAAFAASLEWAAEKVESQPWREGVVHIERLRRWAAEDHQ